MKKNNLSALGLAILICGAMLMSYGLYLKEVVLKPLGLGQDESIVALPFLIFTDDALRYSIQDAQNDIRRVAYLRPYSFGT